MGKWKSTCTCCGGDLVGWLYTDLGFVAGGQDGAFRTYETPSAVPASPWSLFNNGFTLRCDFEPDRNCPHGLLPINPYSQVATATATIETTVPTTMTISWTGLGEQQDPGFDVMHIELASNGGLSEEIARAHAPGGRLRCAPMAPVVSVPPSPVVIPLPVGTHVFFVRAATNDPLYHFGSYYQFELSFDPPLSL